MRKTSTVKKHGVMLEYTLLVCTLLPLLFASSVLIYNIGTDEFGEIGESIVGLYQRIIAVISLPFP